MIVKVSKRLLLSPYDCRGELEVPYWYPNNSKSDLEIPSGTLMIIEVSKSYLLVPL